MCSLTHDYSFCPSPFFLTGDGRMRLIHPESGSDTALVIRESDSRLLESKLWFGHLHSVLFTFHFSIQAICHLYSSLTLSIILFSLCFSFLCINNMHNIKLYRFSKRKLHILQENFHFLNSLHYFFLWLSVAEMCLYIWWYQRRNGTGADFLILISSGLRLPDYKIRFRSRFLSFHKIHRRRRSFLTLSYENKQVLDDYYALPTQVRIHRVCSGSVDS